MLTALGSLIELSRWGLPGTEAVTTDPNLMALLDEYANTLNRLHHAFVRRGSTQRRALPRIEELGGAGIDPTPEEREQFESVRLEALAASGIDDASTPQDVERRVRGWAEFHRQTSSVIGRLSVALGYGGRT